MKYLLDTHTFIWLDSKSSKLSEKAAAICRNPENQLVVSVASIWEMQIKVQLGKMELDASIQDIIAEQKKANRIQVLLIDVPHVLALAELPNYHKDPFDRLLIAQAYVEDTALISHDPLMTKYPITVLW
jgi:PIN domain nuclease of toxin-antitoxin system